MAAVNARSDAPHPPARAARRLALTALAAPWALHRAACIVAAAVALMLSMPAQAKAPSRAATPGAAPALSASSLKADCALLARVLPRVSAPQCEAAGLQGSGAKSVQGFALYQRDVVAGSTALQAVPISTTSKPRRRVLVIGGIHGDELSSSSLVFRWIALAADHPADTDWRFVPVVNPDGLLQKQPSRTNARGVDLNRNFPTPDWSAEARKHWVDRTKKDPRRFPGAQPLSEPESRFVVDTIERWKPDLVVSVHAPYGVLDYDGPSVPPQRLGRLFLDRVGIFPGSLGNYGGVHQGVPVVTIELPSAELTPTEAEMRQIWLDLLRWTAERLPLRDR